MLGECGAGMYDLVVCWGNVGLVCIIWWVLGECGAGIYDLVGVGRMWGWYI